MTERSARARRELKRFLKFGVVGAIGAVVDFGTFNLLANVAGIWHVPASILSFSAAVTSNFLWNRFWVYPDSRSKQVHRQAVQFVVVNVVGLLIRTPVFAFTEAPFVRLVAAAQTRLGGSTPQAGMLSRLEASTLGPNLALALAVVLVLFWNFAINRIWTYSDVT